MFGFFSFLSDFFDVLKAFFIYGALGAAVGFAAAMSTRLIGGASGLIAAMVLGAAIVIGSNVSGYLGAKQDCATQAQIDRLETEKRKLQQELDAHKAANEAQDKIVAEQQKRLNENEAILEELDRIIASHSGDDNCVVHADELQAIERLR